MISYSSYPLSPAFRVEGNTRNSLQHRAFISHAVALRFLLPQHWMKGIGGDGYDQCWIYVGRFFRKHRTQHNLSSLFFKRRFLGCAPQDSTCNTWLFWLWLLPHRYDWSIVLWLFQCRLFFWIIRTDAELVEHLRRHVNGSAHLLRFAHETFPYLRAELS